MKQEETCYVEGGEPVVLLYLPSGTVPGALASRPTSWIDHSLTSKILKFRKVISWRSLFLFLVLLHTLLIPFNLKTWVISSGKFSEIFFFDKRLPSIFSEILLRNVVSLQGDQ